MSRNEIKQPLGATAGLSSSGVDGEIRCASRPFAGERQCLHVLRRDKKRRTRFCLDDSRKCRVSIHAANLEKHCWASQQWHPALPKVKEFVNLCKKIRCTVRWHTAHHPFKMFDGTKMCHIEIQCYIKGFKVKKPPKISIPLEGHHCPPKDWDWIKDGLAGLPT